MKRLINDLQKYFGGIGLLCMASVAMAGQTPGISSPWNGPWGGGYQAGMPYSPLANPTVRAGYPLAGSTYYGNGPDEGYAYSPASQVQSLPGGGFVLPPATGGGMIPGAYGR